MCGSQKPRSGALLAAAFLVRVPDTDVPASTQMTQAKKAMSRTKGHGYQQMEKFPRGARKRLSKRESFLFSLPCVTDGSEQVDKEMGV